jgi:hypothetical protein
VALNTRGLAVRERDDFVSFVSEGNTAGLAAAAQLRFNVVMPKASILPPLPTRRPSRQDTRRVAAGWMDHLLDMAVMEKPFMFIGLPGIELSVCGTALLLYATFGLAADSPSFVPLSVVGALALLFGMTFMTMCAIIVAVRYSMQANGRLRVLSKD